MEKEYMQHFSEASWAKLTPEAKNQHPLTSCTACLSCSPLVQCKFPGTPRRDKENYAQSCTKTLKQLKKSKPQLPLQEAKKAASQCHTNLAGSFELNTGHSLNECSSLTPKSGMKKCLTKQEKQRQLKQIQRCKNVETQLKQSAVKTILGTRMSKWQFQQARMMEGFEELEEARQRVESNTDSKKSHHPSLDNVELGEFDESTLISEVNAYPSDKNINRTELSRKYKLRKVADGSEFGNGGQVLKAYLSSKGVDLDRFQSTSTPRIRQKRKRGPGGETSFPTTATIREVNETIKQSQRWNLHCG